MFLYQHFKSRTCNSKNNRLISPRASEI
jgi:hypothetical protein